jgi:hypothetical protein
LGAGVDYKEQTDAAQKDEAIEIAKPANAMVKWLFPRH